jgi:hypothetical protein
MNLNGLIRQFFPKGQSLAHVTQLDATEAAARLNGRPRKRFNFVAPRRLFAEMTGKSPFFVRWEVLHAGDDATQEEWLFPSLEKENPAVSAGRGTEGKGPHLPESHVPNLLSSGSFLGNWQQRLDSLTFSVDLRMRSDMVQPCQRPFSIALGFRDHGCGSDAAIQSPTETRVMRGFFCPRRVILAGGVGVLEARVGRLTVCTWAFCSRRGVNIAGSNNSFTRQ